MRSRVQMTFSVALTILAAATANTNPVVETTLGSIRGSTLKTAKGREISAFRGIPFAQAPTGDRRFRAPIAVTKWNGELDATKDGFYCPQTGIDESMISEDCLVLNVYTQDLEADRPVIVFIHGGSNMMGGSHSVLEYSPDYLMDANIVLVTINYRLGALGFLSTGTIEAPGNYAYLDQIMAMQWVQEHIQSFGGNRDAVTLMGQSAGARAVSLHLSSPLSKGLFHRAIAMSSSIANHININTVENTRILARQTSCPMYDPDDILNCLRNVSWQAIVYACAAWQTYGVAKTEWTYEIDGNFLQEDPILALVNGHFHRVPLLTGVTKDERDFDFVDSEAFTGNPGILHDFDVNFVKYGPDFLQYPWASSQDKSKIIKGFYFGNNSLQEETLEVLGKIYSDSIENHGVHMLVDLARHFNDVYYYHFEYVGRYSQYVHEDGTPRGIGHSDDLQYIFKKYKAPLGAFGPTDPEWFMVERMVGLISSFAYNGSPDPVDNVQWLPCNKTVVSALHNNVDVRMGEEPNANRMQLWDSLYPIAESGES